MGSLKAYLVKTEKTLKTSETTERENVRECFCDFTNNKIVLYIFFILFSFLMILYYVKSFSHFTSVIFMVRGCYAVDLDFLELLEFV